MPEAGPRIVADIGGTTARFALADTAGSLSHLTRYEVAQFASFETVLDSFLDTLPSTGARCTDCAIAAAGPVVCGTLDMTNVPWVLDEAHLTQHLGGLRVRLFNDLEAVALALPRLPRAALVPIRVPAAPAAGAADEPAARVRPQLVVNVGTGFGAALALADADGGCVIATEAGHVRLAGDLALPGDGPGPCTVEDFLSGPGLERYRSRLSGRADAAEVARSGFSGALGAVVRDLVLATGSFAGLALTGGVLSSWEAQVDTGRFLSAFDDHPTMAALLATVPISRIVHEVPALIGLAGATLEDR